MQTVQVTISGVFQNTAALQGCIRFRLSAPAVVGDVYVAPKEWQEIAFDDTGKAVAELIPNRLISDNSYYDWQVLLKEAGVELSEKAERRLLVQEGQCVVPDYDCVFTNIAICEPIYVDPMEAGKAYANEAKSYAKQMQALIDGATDTVTTARDSAVTEGVAALQTESAAKIDAIKTAGASRIAAVNAAGNTQLEACTSQATLAGTYAQNAALAQSGATAAKEAAEAARTAVEALSDEISCLWLKESGDSVQCYPVPGSALDVTVQIALTETMPAEGEKSPSNPSTITGSDSVTVTRCGAETDTSAEGYEGDTYTIELHETCYGGTLDLRTGKFVNEFIRITLTGNEEPNQIVLNSEYAWYRFDIAHGRYPGWGAPLVSNYFTKAGAVAEVNNIFWTNENSISVTLAFSPEYDTSEKVTAFLTEKASTGNPVCVYYKLANPVEVQLTQTQISALLQNDRYTPKLNTVYSDQSSVTVGYAKSPVQEHNDMLAAIAALQA